MRKSRSALNIVLVLYTQKSNKPINFSYKREEFLYVHIQQIIYRSVYQNNRWKKIYSIDYKESK